MGEAVIGVRLQKDNKKRRRKTGTEDLFVAEGRRLKKTEQETSEYE